MKNLQHFALLITILPVFVESQSSYQKPTPSAYHLKITVPDLEVSNTFEGHVEVNVSIPSTSTFLILEADNLTIADPKTDISILREIKKSPWWSAEEITDVDVSNSIINITLAQSLLATKHKININFTGIFQNKMQGFAKVPFHFNGVEKYLGVTSFEPTYARSVFPCYTDPSHRTSFVLEVTVNKNQTVLSNVKPSQVHNVSDSQKVFVFDAYLAMPVHQLGWAVFDHSTYLLRNQNATTSTVVHTRAPYRYFNHTTWSCQQTASLISELETYLAKSYPLSKIEQVVVPGFFSGTSQGWGLLSYSEEAILVSPGQTSSRDTQRVALELSQGIIGQWFGAYVSMNSWKNMWLVKGISEYLKYSFTSTVSGMSDWELEEHMVVELIQKALALDNENNSLTISSEDEQSTIQTAYNDATKSKGAAVIRMLHNILGDENFNDVLKSYLDDEIEKSSEPETFWNTAYEIIRDSNPAVDLASKSVSEIMDGWVTLKGHPVVNVSTNQTHFLIAQVNSSLYIPITYILEDSASNVQSAWLEPMSVLIIEATSTNKWILVNVNQSGFYRVNYHASLWTLLQKQLASNYSAIPRISRSQLIDDVFSLTMSGVLSTDFLMSFTEYLRHEIDYFPWFTALRNYQNILDSTYGFSSHQLMQAHLLSLMETVVSSVGFVPKQVSHTEKLRQSLILEKACAFGHSDCQKTAVSMLKRWMAGTFYDPDLSMALLCAGVANSTTTIWRTLWQAHSVSVYPTVRANILTALTCSRDATLMNEFLTNLTLSSDPPLNEKDKHIFLETMASTPSGAELILDWLLLILSSGTNQTVQPTSLPPTTPTELAATLVNSIINGSDPNDFVEVYSNHSSADSSSSDGLAESSRRKRDVTTVTETLPEDEIKNILNIIVPKLTTLDQGVKLEKFLNDTDFELTNGTKTFIQTVAKQIYQQKSVAEQYNGQLTVWLSNNIDTEATTGSTTPVSSQSDSTTTLPTGGGAVSLQTSHNILYITAICCLFASYYL